MALINARSTRASGCRSDSVFVLNQHSIRLRPGGKRHTSESTSISA